MPSSPAQPTTVRVTVQRGLEGQDDNIDLLQSYFKELKAVTVEASTPDLDLLTFAMCTHYFGVINIDQQNTDDEDAEGEPEEDSLDAGYIASPPPPSSISSATSFASTRSAVLFEPKNSISVPGRSHIQPPSPEEEKVLKWREAFLAQLQEDGGEEEPLLSEGQYIPEEQRLTPIPRTSNDLDDYINWPDDIPSSEYSGDLHVQGDQLDHETETYSRLDGAEFTTVLGREILEPEQFKSPVELSEIRPDPRLKAFMHEEAIKYQGILRAQRIKVYQEASSPPRPLFIRPSSSMLTPIGIIYLASSQTIDDPMHRGQLNIGIYVTPDYIEQPGLVHAVKEVVKEAFHDTSCHRLQAIVVDHKTKFNTLKLYTSSGFSREGVGRREFFSPITHEWKDVFYFVILATDLVFDNVSSLALPRPKTLWDDLLVCQQREREELLRMEEKTLKRSTSIETIRDKPQIEASIASTSKSEISSVANSSTSAATPNSSVSKGSPKRRRIAVKSDYVKESSTRRPRAPSTSSIGTFDTMSTISSEWELPARPAFAISTSNGASPPITPNVGTSTSSTGNWVILDVSNDN